MLLPFVGYVFATTALAAVAVLLTGLVNTATLEKGRHHPTTAIAPRVKVEMQRHLPVAKKASSAKDDSPVAKEALPAKDASPVASTAKADTQKSKYHRAKVLARQQYRYGNALGYAEESGYGPRGLWFR